VAAQFPTAVKSFTSKVDLVDTVYADHVNSLQDEVRAVELTLGTGLLVSNYSGTFSQASSWASLSERLANIELGLVNGTGATSFFKKTGDTITANVGTIGILVQPSSGSTADLIQTKAANGSTGFRVDSSSIPFVGSSAVIYVGSSAHGLLATLASPTFTGTPQAPTATAGTSTTQIATTAFASTAASSAVSTHAAVSTSVHGVTGSVVGTTNTQTLTNKDLSAASNVFPTTFVTLTGSQTLTQKKLTAPLENFNIVASAATGTINFDALTAAALLYTSNATANFTVNIRGNSGTTLNSLLTVGDSITLVFANTNGTTAYYQTGFQIDGTSVTPRWLGGSAPTAGNASSTDVYTYTVVKTDATPTYTVFASVARFA